MLVTRARYSVFSLLGRRPWKSAVLRTLLTENPVHSDADSRLNSTNGSTTVFEAAEVLEVKKQSATQPLTLLYHSPSQSVSLQRCHNLSTIKLVALSYQNTCQRNQQLGYNCYQLITLTFSVVYIGSTLLSVQQRARRWGGLRQQAASVHITTNCNKLQDVHLWLGKIYLNTTTIISLVTKTLNKRYNSGHSVELHSTPAGISA